MPTKPMSPDEALAIARGCVTEEDLKAVVKAALLAAQGDDATAAGARTFLKDVLLPKDTSKVEDRRFKAISICTFEQYNEVNKFKKTINELRTLVAKLLDNPTDETVAEARKAVQEVVA